MCLSLASTVYEYRTRTFDVYNRRFDILLKDCTKNMYVLAYLLDPSEPLCNCLTCFIMTEFKCAVYFRDGALKLDLPPRHLFRGNTASPLVLQIIDSAILMLEWEQKRTLSGGPEQGRLLIEQITGKYIFIHN